MGRKQLVVISLLRQLISRSGYAKLNLSPNLRTTVNAKDALTTDTAAGAHRYTTTTTARPTLPYRSLTRPPHLKTSPLAPPSSSPNVASLASLHHHNKLSPIAALSFAATGTSCSTSSVASQTSTSSPTNFPAPPSYTSTEVQPKPAVVVEDPGLLAYCRLSSLGTQKTTVPVVPSSRAMESNNKDSVSLLKALKGYADIALQGQQQDGSRYDVKKEQMALLNYAKLG